jgi:toxin secretion/phage lysis holin
MNTCHQSLPTITRSDMDPYVTHLSAIFVGLGEHFTLKTIGTGLLSILSFLVSPDQQIILLGVVVLTIVDFVTGILAAKKEGKTIESRIMVKSAVKLFVYTMMVITTHLIDVAFGLITTAVSLEKATLLFLTATEGFSIFENVTSSGIRVPNAVVAKINNIAKNEDVLK